MPKATVRGSGVPAPHTWLPGSHIFSLYCSTLLPLAHFPEEETEARRMGKAHGRGSSLLFDLPE